MSTSLYISRKNTKCFAFLLFQVCSSANTVAISVDQMYDNLRSFHQRHPQLPLEAYAFFTNMQSQCLYYVMSFYG